MNLLIKSKQMYLLNPRYVHLSAVCHVLFAHICTPVVEKFTLSANTQQDEKVYYTSDLSHILFSMRNPVASGEDLARYCGVQVITYLRVFITTFETRPVQIQFVYTKKLP
jgi:hypothetical protein